VTKTQLGLCAATTAFASTLVGCATFVPKFDTPYYENGAPSTATITREIECELYNLVRNDVPPEMRYKFRDDLLTHNYQIAMLLNLDVTDTGGVAPSFNVPVNSVLAVNAAAELQQAREDSLGLNLNYSLLDDLYLAPRAKKAILATCPVGAPAGWVDTNLAGNLGIQEKVTGALLTADAAASTAAPTATSGEFMGVIHFTLTRNINAVGPTWTLTHFKGPGNFLSASRVNIDTLSFAFAETKPSSPAKVAKTASQDRAQALLDRQFQIDLVTTLSAIRSAQPSSPFF
jgi:hypothetical protein